MRLELIEAAGALVSKGPHSTQKVGPVLNALCLHGIITHLQHRPVHKAFVETLCERVCVANV